VADLLPSLHPIPIKERLSILYVEKGQLDVLDGAFVVVDVTGVRTHIPVGGVACLMLEPGTRVSHAACALAARVGNRESNLVRRGRRRNDISIHR
jgi:CRISPR-associated protein Cas1